MTQRLTIKLSDFEGPLDLLLHLIKQSEMDIFDLPIAQITEQYLTFIHEQQNMQLDVASEYLVMAATLVQIKSADLIPSIADEGDWSDDDVLDPRETLMMQLLTYKQFQSVSAILQAREQTHQQSFSRLPMLVPLKEKISIEPLAPGLNLIDLQSAFERLLRKKKRQQPISRRVVGERYTMAQAFAHIEHQFSTYQVGDIISFDSLFDNLIAKEPMVMVFLALLEMAKADKVRLHQENTLSEIFLEIGAQSENE